MTSTLVNMVPAHKNGYGFVAESDVTFLPSGNRSEWLNFTSRYVIREFAQIMTKNGLYGENQIILSAIPTVISAHKTGTEKSNIGDIAIGDEIVINGIEYAVTFRRYNDPILIRK